MPDKRLWCVRAGGNGEADFLFLKKNQIAISFAEIDDEAGRLPPLRAAFKEAFARLSANTAQAAVPISAGQLYRFVHEMSIGDYVVYPRKSDRTLRWGEVVGPYVYQCEPGGDFGHRRAVRWIKSLPRSVCSQAALYELGSTLSYFEVKSSAAELVGKFVDGARPPQDEDDADIRAARDIETVTCEYICRKIRANLKGYPLEPFVADLFRAMGYNAQATRAVRDDGVDVVAHRDELGIEPPILKIQVKAHEAAIGADCVKAFYAMVEERDVGIFITTGDYTSSAADFARGKGNLKLMDGSGFVELIQKYYDRLDLRFRQQIPLRRILVPDLGAEA